jgi:hypothetical protein
MKLATVILFTCAAAAAGPTTRESRLTIARQLWEERLTSAGGKTIESEHYPTEEALVFLTAYEVGDDPLHGQQARSLRRPAADEDGARRIARSRDRADAGCCAFAIKTRNGVARQNPRFENFFSRFSSGIRAPTAQVLRARDQNAQHPPER